MAAKLSRRGLLRRTLAFAAAGVSLGAVEGIRLGSDLLEQHETWVEASRPNEDFLWRHQADLDRLTIGASFAPEQFSRRGGSQQAMQGLRFAVRELGMRQLRLGLRWNRSIDASGAIDISYYRPYLEYCLANQVDICLNPGPIRVFRWPEEHVPRNLLTSLEVPPVDARFEPHGQLADAAFDHLERLLESLTREYGEDLQRRVAIVQLENEPFYELGQHRWRFTTSYLVEVARRVDAFFPNSALMVTSAGRLHLNIVRDVLATLLGQEERYRGRLASGFDFHYKTPLRDSYPLVRHLDQITYSQPFKPSTEQHVRDGRELGFRIEVTEAQAEPYGNLTSPGNSVKDFRFLILRLMDKVLDPREPALIRMWGVEELAKHFIRGGVTEEHRRIIEIIQSVNQAKATENPPAALHES